MSKWFSIIILVTLMLTFISGMVFADEYRDNGPVISSESKAVVKVEEGRLMGYIDHGTYVFHGVPYARAERFMMPEKVKPWDGLRNATTYGVMCLQEQGHSISYDEFFNPHTNLVQGEDCQTLNINTPAIYDGQKRPVMVYLHGGGFSAGSYISPLTDGRNLSRKGDVVTVSVNHRLNVLGFLDLSAYGDKYKYSGNVGIADIVAALQWIKTNIDKFGGDPDNITIFGQSGGGAKVLTLMAAPTADGLFDKAIVESGASFGFGMQFNNQKVTQKIAESTIKNLGLTPDEVDKLQDVPFNDLLAAANKAIGELGQRYMWGPVKDGDYLPVDAVGDTFAAQSRDIPLMIGTVLNEFTTIIMTDPMELLADNKNDWDEDEAMAKLTEKYGDKAEAVRDAFLKAYPGKKPADAYFVDTMFRPGSIATASSKADQGGAPVYNYVFTYESPVMDGIGMAWHCAELPYVFDNTELVPTATGAGDAAKALAQEMSMAWINFAYNGDPNNKWIPEWPAFTTDNGATMIMDSEWHVGYHHDRELLNLLNR